MSLSKPVLTGHSKKKFKEIRKYKRCGGKKKHQQVCWELTADTICYMKYGTMNQFCR